MLPDEPTPAPGRTDEAAGAARHRGRAGATAAAEPREPGVARAAARPSSRAAAGRVVGDRAPNARSDAAGNGRAEGLLSKIIKR
ncbi:hypothetical protein ACRAR1_03510 [Streptomyces sanyensis]|uniref:hypothetical protein n=1 Tax=Streptomyces sanyensis TaxID=568869 RepID=UPI003D773C0D